MRISWLIGVLGIVCCLYGVSCKSEGLRQVGYTKAPITLCAGGPERDTLSIHSGKYFIRWQFSPLAWKETPDVLVVTVKQVDNPQMLPMTFEVHLEYPAGTKKLGEFSLFPPDEPGVFQFPAGDVAEIQGLASAYLIIKYQKQSDTFLSEDTFIRFDECRWQ